ncbi:MAG: tricarboxylic transporter [Alphaproteobacteria bacterium]|nr:tricarboxylic transporter [Alphaproteobacteria bacterium]
MILHWKGMTMLVLGVLVGLVFGAIPGLGGTTAIALFIPLTFDMKPEEAMALAGGIMGSVSFGGSITAILLNTPGTAPSAATCFDGYPMAQQGRAGAAIGAAGAASSVGGVIGVLLLVAVIPVAKGVILAFGPAEFFMLALLGLVAIAASTGGMFLRGLIAGALGLVLAFVGYDAVSGGERFVFGIEYFWDGIPLVPTLIGLFAVGEMINLSISGGTVARTRELDMKVSGAWEGVVATFREWVVVVRGSALGAFIGAIPGVGGTVAGFLAYTTAMQASKDPESFGKGNIVGVIAPEAPNNAKDGGALLPTLAFGIPGSAEMAVFLGLLILHGLEPGPLLLIEHEATIMSLIVSLTISCIIATVIGLLFTRWLSLITMVDVHVLVPVVVAIAFMGSYALHNKIGDVIVTAAFGVVGYLMIRFRYPRVTLVIALVLGELAERSFHQAMNMTGGGWSVFFTRGISLGIFVLIIGALMLPAARFMLVRRRRAAAAAGGRN